MRGNPMTDDIERVAPPIDLTAVIFNAAVEMGIGRSIIARCLKKQDMTFGQIADKLINAAATIDPKSYFMASVKPRTGTHPLAGWNDDWTDMGEHKIGEIMVSYKGRRGVYSKFTREVVWDE